ncbi:hypothetical protein GCK72_004134 [Caenorhabditis remanei]|uniref:DUF38 domain-containing protein n=1 Tax=Caenorhabditis remanei TaxID=31234 RepID=A0A6A5HAL8_CAERE|nr:hypothetical protein GCK72_004134 [Caenorhabditis remanei]KAF1764187.1 hypothetical protein GCK72_004134 [Caenorhabditis remanei]
MTTARPQPLFYETLKCVGLYLEPNLRFQLSLRCPGFRSVHKTQPVRIHDLKMRPNNFEVNGTVFSVGIIRKYARTTPTPKPVKVSNAGGGVQYDVDRYGIRSDGREEENQEMEAAMRDATRIYRLKEDIQGMVRDRERKRWAVVPELDLRIKAKGLEIRSYRMRMTNQEPPFTQYLQLTITNGTVQNVERVDYDKNLKYTSDYILGRIFGLVKVQVGRLQIGEDRFNSRFEFFLNQFADEYMFAEQQDGPGNAFHVNTLNGQIESLLPVQDGNLEVAEMRVTRNLKNALASIKTKLTNAPLKKLTCAYQLFPDDPIVQNAEFLCVAGIGSLKLFNGRLNNRIHLAECFVVGMDFMNLVNQWAMEKSEVGRFYSIGFSEVKEIEEFFSLFINIPGAERRYNEETRWSQFPECIIIPMRYETELNVWFEETNEEDKVYCNTKFIVKIKVQNSGYAQVHGSF